MEGSDKLSAAVLPRVFVVACIASRLRGTLSATTILYKCKDLNKLYLL